MLKLMVMVMKPLTEQLVYRAQLFSDDVLCLASWLNSAIADQGDMLDLETAVS